MQAMMQKYSKELLDKKKVALWGARMTGLGALRRLIADGVSVSHFIDSDHALQSRSIQKRTVISPAESVVKFKAGEFNAIIISAVLKANDVLETLLANFTDSDIPEIYLYGDKDTPSVTVDILGTCNLKCGSCAHSIENHGVPKGSMSREIFTKVLDKATHDNPELSHISLYSWGDPLLHPHLSDIIRDCHAKNIAVAISSNFSIIVDNRLEDIVKSNPDYFKISVSGYTQKIYQSTHQGGDINLVKSNLYKLRYLMDKHKRDFLVDINYHLYKNNNSKELEQFVSFAGELGFALSTTYALVMPLERVINFLDGKPDFHTSTLNDDFLLVNINDGISASGGRGLPLRECPYLHNQINVNSDLSVPLCCLTFERGTRTIVADNYLNTKPSEIIEAKLSKSICERCQSEGLPEYNLGNRKFLWDKAAIDKFGASPKLVSPILKNSQV